MTGHMTHDFTAVQALVKAMAEVVDIEEWCPSPIDEPIHASEVVDRAIENADLDPRKFDIDACCKLAEVLLANPELIPHRL